MASFQSAEKFFFNPRLRIDGPVAAGSTVIKGTIGPPAKVTTGTGHTLDLDVSHRYTKSFHKQQTQHRRGGIKNLRKVVKGKVTRSRDHLPHIEKEGAFNALKDRSLKKSESVAFLDSLPQLRGTHKAARLYGSQPSLGRRQSETQDAPINPQSMPAGLHYIGSDFTRKLSIPLGSPKKSRMPALPGILTGQIKFEDDLLSKDEAADEDEQVEEAVDDEDGEDTIKDSDNEIVKMIEEHKLDLVTAERDVESDWVLQNELQSMNTKFERRKKHLNIKIADEDPMVVIEKRLQEVKQMTKPKKDQRHVLEKFTPEVRELIMKYKDISVSEIRKARRKQRGKLIDRFRRAVQICRLLLRGFRGTTRYYFDRANVSQLRKKMESLVENTSSVPSGRASISSEMRVALTTQPHFREKKQIKQILWILRATKAFKHLFPAEMENEVARMVAYERYDDGRIIAYQSRTPDRFYYILSGRVNLLRQYKLSTGQVTKSMGFMTKGMTTDPQEIDMQWMREDSLVSKGQVEVLLIDRKPFSMLQHTTDGPPLDFIQSLHLFLEFPVTRFLTSPDAIEVKYYGQGKIIVKDSNRTPWLHIIKSGLVKVVRRQSVIDARLSNESKFTAPTVEHLGCGKSFSHAGAMLGVHTRQKKVKALKETASLPEIKHKTGIGAKSRRWSQTPANPTQKHFRTFGSYIQTPGIEPPTDISQNPFAGTLGARHPIIFRRNGSVDTSLSGNKNPLGFEDDLASEHSSRRGSQQNDESYPGSPSKSRHILSSGDSDNTDDFEPHDLWLTREKTGHESLFPKVTKKVTPNRRAYLQMDVLKPGDVFGLDHLQPALASEPTGVSLLSDGAEVIKISKRFFLQNAENNTMLKVETMYKDYLSEEDAKNVIYLKETWDQYKSALWNRMTAPSPIPSAANR